MGLVEECIEKCVSYKNEGRYEEAQAELEVVLENDPNNIEAHRQLGLIYGFIGLFDESIEELKIALSMNASNVDIRNELALTYSMLGMCDEAKYEFQVVLDIEPNNEVAKKNILYFI